MLWLSLVSPLNCEHFCGNHKIFCKARSPSSSLAPLGREASIDGTPAGAVACS
jgi:hypothetical protein